MATRIDYVITTNALDRIAETHLGKTILISSGGMDR